MKTSHKDQVLGSIKNEITAYLETQGVKTPSVALERPVDFTYGDIASNVALRYAKELQKKPRELAQAIQKYLAGKNLKGISKIDVAQQGFLNFFFDDAFFADVVLDVLSLKSAYGKNRSLQGQKWVIEHTSPNPNKAMHLGHLRNNLVGMSLVKTLEWNGADVVSDAIDNNRGIAIAKLMWGFLISMKKASVTLDTATGLELVGEWIAHPENWLTPAEAVLLPDVFVTKCYVAGEADFKKDEATEQIVRELVVKWEAHDKDTRALWAHVLTYAYEGMNRTLARLGNKWDTIWHEHEHYEDGKQYVEAGLKKGIFKKLEDGAILTELSAYSIPDTILLKKDGTSLYITQDIALTALKKKKYHADKLVWVIGPEQSLAMKQLFAVCEQLGIGKLADFEHVTYGYVGLKDADGSFKKMSSRDGSVVLIDDVIDIARDKVLAQFEADGRDAGNAETKALAEKIALAAVKFSILKSDRAQDLTFDVDRSIETKGDSGIYILYTYARIQSMLAKAKEQGIKIEAAAIDLKSTKNTTANLLLLFPQIVGRSKEDLSVHHVAQYLLDLCSAFSGWYSREVILDGSETQGAKLALAQATGEVIKNALSILGIPTIEKM